MKKKEPRTSKTQSVTPYLLYNDVGKALAWLSKAFGFLELGERFEGKDGTIQHAAMVNQDGGDVIMMGCPGPKYKNPKKLGVRTQMLYINVGNVDKHFARAKKMKPKVVNKLEDTFYGDRRYGVEDPEGHQWYFAQRVREVSEEEMKKAAAERG
jgi:PhnB protein